MEQDQRSYRDLKLPVVLALASLALVLFLFNHFVDYVEKRPGVMLDDPILARLGPYDLTEPIFILIYFSTIAGFYLLSHKPYRLIVGVQAYFWLTCMRLITMYTIPLDPPHGMIILRDPVVEFFGSGRILTRDLFFSGHTSLAFLIALVTPVGRWKKTFFTMTFLIGLFLIVQHVHYSLDVVCAPFFSYCAVRISERVCARFIRR